MILVVGSTGNLGSAVTSMLAQSGEDVAGLTRNPESVVARQLASQGVTIIRGDMRDPASIEEAMKCVDTVVATATAVLSREPDNTLEAVDHQGMQTVIQKADRGDPKRFVYISFPRWIADDECTLTNAKAAGEKALSESSLDWIVLRPNNFMEVWFSPIAGFDVDNGIRIYGDGNAQIRWITVEDTAKGTVAAATAEGLVGETIPMGGSDAVSQHELVDHVEKIRGSRPPTEQMPIEAIQQYRKTQPEPMSSILALGINTAKGEPTDQSWTERLGAPNPTGALQWLSQNVK